MSTLVTLHCRNCGNRRRVPALEVDAMKFHPTCPQCSQPVEIVRPLRPAAQRLPVLGLVHVVPLNDLREHLCAIDCWCKPTASEDEPRVIVHHAMDKREEFEPDNPRRRPPA